MAPRPVLRFAASVLAAVMTLAWGQRAIVRAASTPTVLVLHDSGGQWGYLGGEYAIMLGNLLGHFGATVTHLPVTQYSPGLVNQYGATFYLGSTYDEPSFYATGSPERGAYDAFLADAATSTKPLVWVNHNLWKLAWAWNPAWDARGFSGRFGIQFVGVEDSSYNRVAYKNTELWKGVVPHVNPGADLTGCVIEPNQPPDGLHACSQELNAVAVVDATLATVQAGTYSTITGATAPYITKAANLWVVGDIPFSYISEEDRYLAFADLLHDILGVDHAETHRALIRLEDVSAADDPNVLGQAADELALRNVRFSVATIPIYRDPLGVENDGVPQQILLHGSPAGTLLQQWRHQSTGDVLQEGTTHQWDGADNPYSEVSGDDFEFYRVIQNPDFSLTFVGPLPGDSAEAARSRILEGRDELKHTGLNAFAWSAPHFMASAVDYTAIARIYGRHYGRSVYFSSGSPAGRFIGQFYPYLIERDAYGYSIIPENIGYIEPTPIQGYAVLLPPDLIERATKALVVRDGFASFYYHASLGTSYLDQTVTGIQQLGYTFVGAACLDTKGPHCSHDSGKREER